MTKIEEEETMFEAVARCAKPLALATAIAAVFAASPQADAQGNFPNRPVRLVNPYTPGGSVDLVGRAVAGGLSELWGQQVIVDNRPGAGTQIGTEIVVRAEPDGYTMLCNSSAIAIMPSMYRNVRFDTIRDVSPIVQVASSNSMLAVHPDLPVKSVKDLIALARAKPGEITVAASGIGSTNHLTAEMFKMMAGVDLLVVPYKGGGPAIVDLLGGQVKMFFNSAAQFMPLSQAGKVRVLATTGPQRADYAPNIPTVAEQGLPGFESQTWYAIYGPRALPPALAEKWNESVNRYLNTAQAKELFRSRHMRPVGGSIASFTQYHRSETARWAKVIRAARIQTQ